MELTTLSGQQLRFVIESVDEAGLHGEGWDVSFSDIERLSRKEISARRTLLMVSGVVVAGVAVGSAAAAASVADYN